MSPRRRAGAFALIIGLALVVGGRLVPGLGGPPLYDGILPVGPYQWLQPSAGQQGGAQGASATVAVHSGQNDLLALATPESLPQAQVLAIPGSLVLAPDATSLSASIEPVAPPGQPSNGQLASNIYRFTVKDQNGAEASARLSANVSIVIRSADAALANGIVERWNGTAWVPLKAGPPGFSGTYLAIVTEFGDYVVVQPGATASPGGPGASGASAGSTHSTAVASGGVSGSGGAGSTSPSPEASATSPADSGSGSPGAVVPLLVAALVGGVVLAALVLVGGARNRRPPGRFPGGRRGSTYRGAHKIDDR